MQFPTTFPFLVIPTGAANGQRITINFEQDGEIKVYDANGVLVDTIGGTDGDINITSPNGTRIDLNPTGPRSGGAEIDLYPDTSGDFVAIEAVSGTLFGPRMLVDTGTITHSGSTYNTFFDIEPSAFSAEALVNGATGGRLVIQGTEAFLEHDPSGNAVVVSESGVAVSGRLTASNIQTGSFTQAANSTAGDWTTNVQVNFPNGFASTPNVVVMPVSNGPGSNTATALMWQATTVTTTSFMFRHLRGNTGATTTFNYIAIG